jgi:small subunit ribosomal protein S20
MNQEKTAEKKVKRPTALKRDLQNEKRRLINKSFKSVVRTTLRDFDETLSTKDKEKIQSSLNEVFSILDKGVKRGVFKVNKAARTKARAHDKCCKATA